MRRSLSIAVVLCLAVGHVFAQESPATSRAVEPLTLSVAVREALAQNVELIALRHDYETARAAPAQERFLAPPMFETQIWGWPVTTLNPVQTDMYMFMVEQELPGRGKRDARALVAARDAAVSQQQIAVRANEIVGQVKQAYFDLALSRDIADLYTRQAPLLQDMTEAATLRYASGRGGQHHTITSLVEVTKLERQRIVATERIETAETRLNALLGRPVGQPVETLAPITGTVSIAEAEQRALAGHPELAMVATMVEREEAELARLRGERRPDFVVGGGYMLMPGGAGAWTARAGLTWPNAPWSRGRLTAITDVQTRRVDAVRARRDVAATRIRQEVREAATRLTSAERQVQLIGSTILPQVEHAFELARVSYGGGEGAFLDMLDAQRLLLSVQLEHAEAKANVGRARVDLERAMGVL